MLHGHTTGSTVMPTPAPGVSTFALSSAARDLVVRGPGAELTRQVKVHAVVPLARCQLVPPSMETSTPPTKPPVSVAVPLITTSVFCVTCMPAAIDVMLDVGLVLSVDALAATSPDCRV